VGTFDKETGDYFVEGNIYTVDKEFADSVIAEWRPIPCEALNTMATTGVVNQKSSMLDECDLP
jgi:hypothetical protein